MNLAKLLLRVFRNFFTNYILLLEELDYDDKNG